MDKRFKLSFDEVITCTEEQIRFKADSTRVRYKNVELKSGMDLDNNSCLRHLFNTSCRRLGLAHLPIRIIAGQAVVRCLPKHLDC